MVPKAVLINSGLVSVNTARQVNTAHTKTIVNGASPIINFTKTAHLTVKRPINKNTTFKNSNQRVNTVRDNNVNTARPKAVVNVVKGNHVNAVKGNLHQDFQEKRVIDSGCSRHMTGNMSYLIDFEEIDGGYVAFRGNPKGGKIIGRGTIKTGTLDFENMYFLTDESHVLLKVPRKNNMYSVDLKNIVPKRRLTYLFAKATSDESNLWHRRLGYINVKTMNKLVKRNLIRGLPSKLFENNQICVACQKGKQHRSSCKSKTISSISQPLHMLHMDLFGPTFVKSLMKKMYCLVVTDDYSRFSWVFFLATKDKTSGIFKSFITGVENLIDQRVKVIRCDNGTEFNNKEMNQFYERKDIKREFSVARTPQQNGVAERKNRTLIEAARTMLANSKLPTTFYAKVVNIACYVQNMVLVTKPYNKTPYELFLGRKPALVFMRPFGYPVTILNTIDHLGKFDGKADERFFVGYSISSKAFRVFNNRTRIVKENLHVQFSENTPNIARSTKACNDASKARMESVPGKDYILLPLKKGGDPSKEGERGDQEKDADVNSTNSVYTVSSPVNAADLPVDPNMPPLEDIVYSVNDEDVGAESNMNNLNAFMPVSPIPTTRVHKDHPVEQIIGDLNLAPQTRRMTKNLEEYWFVNGCQECFSLGKIKEEVYVCQPPGFEDPDFPDRVYKVEKKFGFTEVKTTSTPMKTQKPLLKDEDGKEVDIYLYRLMIGSLMYLTSLRPDIMFIVCTCAR
ncbi:putative ribonuclease H-like domain-containing protein [Tanacetum coccineum]